MKFSKKYKCLLLFLLFLNFFILTNTNKNILEEHKNFRKRKSKNKVKSKSNENLANTTDITNSNTTNTNLSGIINSNTTNTNASGIINSNITTVITNPLQGVTPPPAIKRLSDPDYISLNKTFVTKNINQFKAERIANAKNFKIQPSQLDEVFSMLTLDDNKQSITPDSTRTSIKLFIENFELCDDDKNNLLSLLEFKSCLKINEYFKVFDLDMLTEPDFVKKIIENNKNYTNLYDADTFSTRIFTIMDENGNGYMNFYDFMILRLISFAWRKCGNVGLFIAEMQFECAIDIIAKTKTLQRNSLRTLFEAALEISNFESERNLDLTTFILVSLNYRLYGKINQKSNGDVHKDQLDSALHSSALPIRYDAEIVQVISKMFDSTDKPDQGIDPHTFLFVDLSLRMFKMNQTKNLVDYEGFSNIMMHPIFPKKIIEEFFYVPQFSLTTESYNRFVSGDTPKRYDEGDFFMKKFRFRNKNEMKMKTDMKQPGVAAPARPAVPITTTSPVAPVTTISTVAPVTTTTTGSTTTSTIITRRIIKKINPTAYFYLNFNTNSMKTFDFPFVSSLFFQMMDFPQQQKISFEEFLNFLEIMHIYKKIDTHKSGKLNREILIEHFNSFVGYPKPTIKISQRIDNLKLVPHDTILNLFYTYGMFRIEDLKSKYTKQESLNNMINEVDLQTVLHLLNINEFPINRLESCLSTHAKSNINYSVPYYEWDCAIGKAISIISTLLKNEEDFKTVHEHSIKLENTVFENFPTPVPNPLGR